MLKISTEHAETLLIALSAGNCLLLYHTKMKNFYRELRDVTKFVNIPWHNEVNSIYITISMTILAQNQQKLFFSDSSRYGS